MKPTTKNHLSTLVNARLGMIWGAATAAVAADKLVDVGKSEY